MELGREYLSKDGGTWLPDLPLVKTPSLSQDGWWGHLTLVKMGGGHRLYEETMFLELWEF